MANSVVLFVLTLVVIAEANFKFSCTDRLEETVDITDGDRNNTTITFDNVTYTPENFFNHNGKMLVNRTCMEYTTELNINVHNGVAKSQLTMNDFYLIKTAKLCSRPKYMLTEKHNYCPTRLEEVIDITTGEKNNDVIVYNDITFNSTNYFVYQRRTYGCVCNIKTCLTKCCPEGERFINEECQKFDNEINITVYKGTEMLKSNPDNLYLIKGNICTDGIVSLTENQIEYYIQENGDLHTHKTFTDRNKYCIDGDENGEIVVFVCYTQDPDEEEMSTAMLIGLECEQDPIMIPGHVGHYIQENGHVYSTMGNFTDTKSYCIEGTEDSKLVVLVCNNDEDTDEMEMMMMGAYYIGKVLFYSKYESSYSFAAASVKLVELGYELLLPPQFSANLDTGDTFLFPNFKRYS
ncbi:hypothetical protein Trydic_g8850 [Trypoxylus dichotomus]